MDTTNEILKKFWGFENFRPRQESIVKDIVSGKDVLALLPTGGGKSLCFQLSGIMRGGLTLVISPLISLMQDQVKKLQEKGLKTACIYSGMSYREIDNTLDNVRFGDYQFLYVSPERLQTKIFIERFKRMKIGLIVVDEAHCISQWGHDFRPAYTKIHELRQFHPDIPIAAFTATATKETKLDIVKELKLKKYEIHETSFERKNIAYRILRTSAKNKRLIEFCTSLKSSTGIVYCQTRKSVKEVTQLLKSNGLSCGSYHGGMDKEQREQSMDLWMNESVRIMIATNAFGMGIDKANVRYVFHYEISDSIEAYFQEAGRAGRDQRKAIALTFVEDSEIIALQELTDLKFPPATQVKSVYKALCNSLRIAFGSGKDEVYDLDLNHICKTYKFDARPTYNALKLLELNGMISLSEGVYHPNRVKIMVKMSTLYDFEVQHASLKNVSQYLIRKHPGVFESYKKIELNSMSALLKETSVKLNQKLQKLHEYGIIDYIAASSKPTIGFLRERPPNDDFTLHSDLYNQRKKIHKKQTNAVIALIENEECKAASILDYFDQENRPCGQCNICIQKEHSNENIDQKLLELCSQKTTVSWLMNLTGYCEKDINGFINKAENEDLISIEGQWIHTKT